ncbi:MAG: hypothetical protein K2J08_00175 [Ruminococcus sp.]|nr:hypothetical protein [Ruminococcus sp.]
MKKTKLLTLLSACVLAVSAVPVCTNADILKGDANQDGVVDNLDVKLIFDLYDECSDEEYEAMFPHCDINEDGIVNYDDAYMLAIQLADISSDTIKGDINHDGLVDCVDVSLILSYYVDCSTVGTDKYSEAEIQNFLVYGDINGDGHSTVVDASMILQRYSENSRISQD